jgi:hypothetical protein
MYGPGDVRVDEREEPQIVEPTGDVLVVQEQDVLAAAHCRRRAGRRGVQAIATGVVAGRGHAVADQGLDHLDVPVDLGRVVDHGSRGGDVIDPQAELLRKSPHALQIMQVIGSAEPLVRIQPALVQAPGDIRRALAQRFAPGVHQPVCHAVDRRGARRASWRARRAVPVAVELGGDADSVRPWIAARALALRRRLASYRRHRRERDERRQGTAADRAR